MKIENITINCLGASNTRILIDDEGKKARDINYPVMLGLRLRCNIRNYGVSGTNIAMQEGRTDSYLERAPMMEEGADIIIVQGGGNDANHNIPLGELDSADPYTYCGAIRSLIRALRRDFPDSRLIFSAAMRRKKLKQRSDDLGWFEFHEAFVSVCRSEGIDPIDFWYDDALDPNDPASLPDGTHMSETACGHMADVFAEYIRKLYGDRT